MKKTNKVFVLFGCILICAILAYKFGLFRMNRSTDASSALERKSAQATQSASFKPESDGMNVSEAIPEKKSAESSPASVPDQEKSPSASIPAESGSNSRMVPKREPVIPGLGDPFSYSAQNSDDSYPMLGEKKLGTISVKGIVRLKGEEPVAILHLNDTGRDYYVSRGDVIRITESAGNGKAPLTEAYVVIKDVRDEEVELIQQERPDKVIIIR